MFYNNSDNKKSHYDSSEEEMRGKILEILEWLDIYNCEVSEEGIMPVTECFLKDLLRNEYRANKKYDNKIVIIFDRVSKIEKAMYPRQYYVALGTNNVDFRASLGDLQDKARFRSVCFFIDQNDEETLDVVSNLHIGDMVVGIGVYHSEVNDYHGQFILHSSSFVKIDKSIDICDFSIAIKTFSSNFDFSHDNIENTIECESQGIRVIDIDE